MQSGGLRSGGRRVVSWSSYGLLTTAYCLLRTHAAIVAATGALVGPGWPFEFTPRPMYQAVLPASAAGNVTAARSRATVAASWQASTEAGGVGPTATKTCHWLTLSGLARRARSAGSKSRIV